MPQHYGSVRDPAGNGAIPVYVVDDEETVLRAMGRLLRSAGMRPRLFTSVEELMGLAEAPGPFGCVIADIRLHGRSSGLELPDLLRIRGWELPVIFLSAQDTDHYRAAAKRAGAAAFFRKPVDDQALIDAIRWAARNGRRDAPVQN
jgi:FixJ family two-component response regulator